MSSESKHFIIVADGCNVRYSVVVTMQQNDNTPHVEDSKPAVETPPQLSQKSPSDSQKKTPLFNRIRGFLSTAGIFIAAILLAWLMITFVFQTYVVDGPSMEPTLSNNDRLIVQKLGRTWARITNESYIPDRGSIIVFEKHGLYEYGTSQNKQLIKRVIGLPGDRVVVRDGVLTIYNDENPQGFRPDQTLDYGDSIRSTNGNVDIVVGEGELFVAGDNRSNSYDSRSFGTIDADNVIGELKLRILPLDKATAF